MNNVTTPEAISFLQQIGVPNETIQAKIDEFSRMTAAGGGIARIVFQEGGDTMMSEGINTPENSSMEQEALLRMNPEQAIQIIVNLLIEQGIDPESAQQLALQILQIFSTQGEEGLNQFVSQLEQDEEMQEPMMMAGGGIAGLYPRQGYFIGKAVKSVGKAVSGVVKGVGSAVKSIAKSPIGKIALTIAAAKFGGPLLAPYLGSAAAGAGVAAGLGNIAVQLASGQKFNPVEALISGVGGYAGAGGFGGAEQASAFSQMEPYGGSALAGADKLSTQPGFLSTISKGAQDLFTSPVQTLSNLGTQAADLISKYPKTATALGIGTGYVLGGGGQEKKENEVASTIDTVARNTELANLITRYGGYQNIRNPLFYSQNNALYPAFASEGGRIGYGIGGLLTKYISDNPQMFKQTSNLPLMSDSKTDFVDANQDGIDDREQVSYGGRIGFLDGGDPEFKGWLNIYNKNPDAASMHPRHKEFLIKLEEMKKKQQPKKSSMLDLNEIKTSRYVKNNDDDDDDDEDEDKRREVAFGGRMRYAYGNTIVPPSRMIEGGIMELDARESGGFIPYGKKERHDDVPAILAKNEFVMTADAVRGAGNGDINKGADRMNRLMKNLEARGAMA